MRAGALYRALDLYLFVDSVIRETEIGQALAISAGYACVRARVGSTWHQDARKGG